MIGNIFSSQKGMLEVNESGKALSLEENLEKNASLQEKNEEAYELSLSEEGWAALELSEEDKRKVEEMKRIDQKVRTHEQAHLSAAGGYARGVNYDYVTGPDGKRYANSGHVNLDVSPESTPEATIRKANVIKKAALAPADPSPADKQIAANATKMAMEAQRQIAEEAATAATDATATADMREDR
ncbi:MAG: hypothetical protein LBC85_11565 [Fibromonadaceae bacterium]|jgi:hypothetical protein|nr:hypothetical protein [Fibromonadaceae bacterium]